MIWMLVIINLGGGEPALVPMPSQAVCEKATEASELHRAVYSYCIARGPTE
jgi:hypothetical protein